MKQIDLKSSTDICKVDERIEEVKSQLSYIMNEMGDVCKEIIGDRKMNQECKINQKRTSRKRKSK